MAPAAKSSGKMKAKLSPSRVRRAGAVEKQQLKLLEPRRALSMLASLHRHTKGRAFSVQVFRSWLRQRLAGTAFKLPAPAEAHKLLAGLSFQGKDAGGLRVWQPHGVCYRDKWAHGTVDNIQGFAQGPPQCARRWVLWNESGSTYRVDAVRIAKLGLRHQVIRAKAFKRLTCTIERKTLAVPTQRGEATFKNTLVLEPRLLGSGRASPPWTFIYLHSFSSSGRDYADYPHYFGVSSAAIRIVLPTAPLQETTCFKDWWVPGGKRVKWRRVKFNSWFDYTTDKGGVAENHINLDSLLEMRERIHALIRKEVQRVGDPRRVILGGASQGCCLSLDAALTYPDVLGGVIGIVGHVLGCTPLDQAKRKMPLYLFNEATDKEMPWRWVEGTVQRLIDAGFNVTSHREADPANCGHWVQDIEGQWIRSALRKIAKGEPGA